MRIYTISYLKQIVLIIILLVSLIILYFYNTNCVGWCIDKVNLSNSHIITNFTLYEDIYEEINTETHEAIVENYMLKRKDWTTSNLGSILFLNEDSKKYANPYNKNRVFIILIWKYYDWLMNRHLKSFTKTSTDPMLYCSVKNCVITGNDNDIDIADAVVVHLQNGEIPSFKNRLAGQRWIFLTDESPQNTFDSNVKKSWINFIGVFNWSMTYRSDADVPVPYGRVKPLKVPLSVKSSVSTLIPHWKKKKRDVLVAAFISTCSKYRMDFIKELSRYIEVDVYGKCSNKYKKSCPDNIREDCKLTENYLFHLVFENYRCSQYLTERTYHHAYHKGAIPIIMGPSVEDCDLLLPPASYIHVDNYPDIETLSKDIVSTSKNEVELLLYHKWRIHFEVLNEHGYFGIPSRHYCRVCEALNYNKEVTKIYDSENLQFFLDPKSVCNQNKH